MKKLIIVAIGLFSLTAATATRFSPPPECPPACISTGNVVVSAGN